MLDSVTIISKTGVVLYHHDLQSSRTGSSSSSSSSVPSAAAIETINTFISCTLLDRNKYEKARKMMRTTVAPGSGSGSGGAGGGPSMVVEWEEMSALMARQRQNKQTGGGTNDPLEKESATDSIKKDWIVLATYPSILISAGSAGKGGGSTQWIRHFLRSVLREYGLYYDAAVAAASDTTAANMQLMVPDATKFDASCRALLRRSENLGRRGGGNNAGDVPASFAEGVDYYGEEEGEQDEDAENDQQDEQADEGDKDDDARARARAALKNRNRRGSAATNHESAAPKKKGGKEERVWHDGKGKMTKTALKNLDRSKGLGAGEVYGIDAAIAEDSAALAEARAAYLPDTDEVPAWEEDDVLVDDDIDIDDDDSSGTSGWGSSLKGLFDQMSGNKVLTKEDLDGPLEEMKRMLTSKNVANEVASEVCEGVRDKLVGKKMNSFGRVKTAVRHALESAVEKILKPGHGRDVDVLHSVVSKREGGSGFGSLFGSSSKSNHPYTIVMVGINGVGKSTSLAKIAYYLKSNGCNPLLAACDTFRSGAVEQLNVHAKCLDVPLYHKGYAKDPSAVAKAAINHATEEGNDVVLVDTAGRMQNNVPLMKALSKLVVENQPDLVLFVCEALVGNDGMDQLYMFDKALRTGGHSRQIDGIVLTKFDTVSDKVGAALTMTHITGAPVVFIGTGQKYNHLKKLSVQSVIKSLFS